MTYLFDNTEYYFRVKAPNFEVASAFMAERYPDAIYLGAV